MWRKHNMQNIIGNRIERIYMNERSLTFVTDAGPFSFEVEGDCCSYSYFHDFYGVEGLLGSKVTAFESVGLAPGDVGYRKETWEDGVEDERDYNVIEVYGYRLTYEHPQFGDRSAVLSFRNSSNGYYGGWMDDSDHHLTDEAYRVLQDVIQVDNES